MTAEDIKIITDVSKHDPKTREALTTLIEVAYAAHKRGVLPNEATKSPCFTNEQLEAEGFIPWRYDESKWERGEMVLCFDNTGMARLTLWRGRSIVAHAGANNIHQLRNLYSTPHAYK